MKITEFKKGDIITKVEPRKYNVTEGMFGSVTQQDVSYIGGKYKYIGSANGLAYIEDFSCNKESPNYGDRKDFKLCQYSDGWEKWVDPEKL